jgi:hypothetical protein
MSQARERSLVAELLDTGDIRVIETKATAALARLLVRSADARLAIADILEEHVPGLRGQVAHLAWSGEVTEGGKGRPDFIATDASGPRVVIEGKLDYHLREYQLNGDYLNRLPLDQPGVYALLLPQRHLADYLGQLLAGHGVAAELQAGHAFHPVGDGRYLGAMSWELVLNGIVRHTGAIAEYARQLQDLLLPYADPAWVPIVDDGFYSGGGAQVQQVRRAVEKATARMAGDTYEDRGERPWSDGFGRYVAMRADPRRFVWVGIWMTAWEQHGITPVWIKVHTSTLPLAAGLRLLDSLAAPGTRAVQSPSGGALMPVVLPATGQSGDEEIVDVIAERISTVLQALEALPDSELTPQGTGDLSGVTDEPDEILPGEAV